MIHTEAWYRDSSEQELRNSLERLKRDPSETLALHTLRLAERLGKLSEVLEVLPPNLYLYVAPWYYQHPGYLDGVWNEMLSMSNKWLFEWARLLPENVREEVLPKVDFTIVFVDEYRGALYVPVSESLDLLPGIPIHKNTLHMWNFYKMLKKNGFSEPYTDSQPLMSRDYKKDVGQTVYHATVHLIKVPGRYLYVPTFQVTQIIDDWLKIE